MSASELPDLEAWLGADCKRLRDGRMPTLIRAIHAELKGAYGSPRMVRELWTRGFSASKERVERLMRDNGIHACDKRHYRVTTDSRHGLPVAERLLSITARRRRQIVPGFPTSVCCSKRRKR